MNHVISIDRALELQREGSLLGVSYGAGVDSTAMLIMLYHEGVVPDFVVFSDTGDEKPPTYAYLDTMDEWMSARGWPAVIRVCMGEVDGEHGTYSTLEGNCLVNQTLPGAAFGNKSCSGKYKSGVMEREEARWAPVQETWSRGHPVIKLIGYNAGAADSRRGVTPSAKNNYLYAYPLRDREVDRAGCVSIIRSEGLPVPLKSACWHCPFQTPEDLRDLAMRWPRFARRIIQMEARAYLKGLQGYDSDTSKGIFGMWGRGRKGRFDHVVKRPGSMSEFLAGDRVRGQALLPEFEHNPLGLVDWWNCDGYHQSNPNGTLTPDRVWDVCSGYIRRRGLSLTA